MPKSSVSHKRQALPVRSDLPLKRTKVYLNIAHGAGDIMQFRYAMKTVTTMTDDEITTLLLQLKEYPSDRVLILGDLNKILSKCGMYVTYTHGVTWQKGWKLLK